MGISVREEPSGDVIFPKTARRRLKYPYDSRREARSVKPISDYLAHFERRRCLFLDSKWCYIIARTASSWYWEHFLSLSRCHLRRSCAALVVFSARALPVKISPDFFFLQCHVRVFARPWRRCMDVNGIVEVRRIVYHDMMRRFRLEYDIGYDEECDVAGASVAKARVSIVCSGEISQVKFFLVLEMYFLHRSKRRVFARSWRPRKTPDWNVMLRRVALHIVERRKL